MMRIPRSGGYGNSMRRGVTTAVHRQNCSAHEIKDLRSA